MSAIRGKIVCPLKLKKFWARDRSSLGSMILVPTSGQEAFLDYYRLIKEVNAQYLI